MDTQLELRDVDRLLAELSGKLSGAEAEKWFDATTLLLRGENPWPERAILPPIPDCFRTYDPTPFITEGLTAWRGPIDGDGLNGDEFFDPRSLQLRKLDLNRIEFTNGLGKGESMFTGGRQRLSHIIESGQVRLGGNIVLALWANYQQDPANSLLEWLRMYRGIGYFDLPGLILRDRGGDPCVLFMQFRSHERKSKRNWWWSYHRLDQVAGPFALYPVS